MFTEEDYSNAGELERALWDCCGVDMSQKEDVKRVKKLLEMGANPSHLNNYAIGLASQEGYATILNLMLDHPDVDPRKYDEGHAHPLILASNNGYIGCVRVLLGHCKWDKDTIETAIE
ncbi:Hypothetical protein POVR2_LOCUS273 [uncultured virus]|nr:Hypothetical protein POVR2_LOCUS273 [uncultured virus]